MVQAVALLRERGEDVILELVGWAERGDPILEEIQALAREKDIMGAIQYAGSRPLGPELFAFYRQADIFLIASLASEGFPRAIWEAMAHSLPVIATKVGSIPSLVEDAAVLITPGSAETIANAVLNLIQNPEIRQNMIRQGFERVQGVTLENQTGELMAKIKTWLEKKSHG
jgi:glycosyltransferase involved in cell wall biosynthesis